MPGLTGRLARLQGRIVDRSPRPHLLMVGVCFRPGVEVRGGIMFIGAGRDDGSEGRIDGLPPLEDLIPPGPDHGRLLALAEGCERLVMTGYGGIPQGANTFLGSR